MSAVVLPPPGQAAMGPTARPEREQTATEYWSQYIRSVAGPLLKVTGSYAPEDQEAHLRLMDSHFAPLIGPKPSEHRGVYNFPYAGSPVEFAVTSTSGAQPKVHVQFELDRPSGARADDDPFGEAAGRDVMRRVASAVGGDTRWMESLISSLHMTPEEVEVARPIASPCVPAGFVGLAFDGPKKVMKAYCVPMLKAVGARRTPAAVGLEAVRKLEPGQEGLGPQVDLLEEYLNSRNGSVQLLLIGVDCVDPKDARVKIYLFVESNAWDVVQDVMTLGGRLDDEQTRESLEKLRAIYPLLRNEVGAQRGDDWSKPDNLPGTQFSGLQLSVELGPSKKVPEIKFYAATFQYTPNSDVAMANYQKVLEKLDLEWGRDGKFLKSMETIFQDKPIVGLGHVSYTYSKKKGVYSSFYLAAPTENEIQEWEPHCFDSSLVEARKRSSSE